MKAVEIKHKYWMDGKEVVEAFIISDETPETLPTTGEGIECMNSDQVFAPLSVIYVVGDAESKVYIAGEDGQFVAQ